MPKSLALTFLCKEDTYLFSALARTDSDFISFFYLNFVATCHETEPDMSFLEYKPRYLTLDIKGWLVEKNAFDHDTRALYLQNLQKQLSGWESDFLLISPDFYKTIGLSPDFIQKNLEKKKIILIEREEGEVRLSNEIRMYAQSTAFVFEPSAEGYIKRMVGQSAKPEITSSFKTANEQRKLLYGACDRKAFILAFENMVH
jgi:hypothetical protein